MDDLNLAGRRPIRRSQPTIRVSGASGMDEVPVTRLEEDRLSGDQFDLEPKSDGETFDDIERRVRLAELYLGDLPTRHVSLA